MPVFKVNFEKSSGYLSALKLIDDQDLLLALDEIRENIIKERGTWEAVDGFEKAVTMLKLDFGYPDEDVKEVLQESFAALEKEAAINEEGAKRRFGRKK